MQKLLNLSSIDIMELPSNVAQLMSQFVKAEHIVAFTGAGMSAESGVPTFRDAQHALWADYDPEALATPQAWRAAPARVWAWYEWRRAMVAATKPHVGHLALAEMQRQRRVTVVTQNVDDLHERAGNSTVVHVHGSLFAPRCAACHRPGNFAINGPAVNPSAPMAAIEPPRCTHCGGRLRPGVVWFGEALPETPWQQAIEAMKTADLLLVIGTSAIVHPSARLPEMARRRDIPILVINPHDTDHSSQQGVTHWRGTAAQALPMLLHNLSAADVGRNTPGDV